MTTKTIDHIWMNALCGLLKQPVIDSRNGPMREILGYTTTPHFPYDPFLRNERRALSKKYAAAETLWYLMETDSTKWIKKFAPSYEKFEDKPDKAHGAYGWRIYNDGYNQLIAVVKELEDNRNSRRAVISLYNSNDLHFDSKDIPCTCNLKFYMRQGKVHMISDMRSNDVWLGFPYDYFAFVHIGRAVAAALATELASYCHQAGSLHLYQKNESAAKQATKFFGISEPIHPPVPIAMEDSIQIAKGKYVPTRDVSDMMELQRICNRLKPLTEYYAC